MAFSGEVHSSNPGTNNVQGTGSKVTNKAVTDKVNDKVYHKMTDYRVTDIKAKSKVMKMPS